MMVLTEQERQAILDNVAAVMPQTYTAEVEEEAGL